MSVRRPRLHLLILRSSPALTTSSGDSQLGGNSIDLGHFSGWFLRHFLGHFSPFELGTEVQYSNWPEKRPVMSKNGSLRMCPFFKGHFGPLGLFWGQKSPIELPPWRTRPGRRASARAGSRSWTAFCSALPNCCVSPFSPLPECPRKSQVQMPRVYISVDTWRKSTCGQNGRAKALNTVNVLCEATMLQMRMWDGVSFMGSPTLSIQNLSQICRCLEIASKACESCGCLNSRPRLVRG